MKCKFKVMKKATRIILVVAMIMTTILPMGVIAFENRESESFHNNNELTYTIDYSVSIDTNTAKIYLTVAKDSSLVLEKYKTIDDKLIDFSDLASDDEKYYIEDEVSENKEYTYVIYYQAMVVENDVVTYVDKEKKISIVIDDIPLANTNEKSSLESNESTNSYAVQPRAFEITSGNFYYTILDDTSVAVAGRYGSNKDLVIPTTVTSGGITYNVTAIAKNAFYTSKDITSIVIPNSITSIGDDAFKQNTGMTSITIPGSVKTMGKSIFIDATRLKTVVFEEGVTEIPTQMFSDVSTLTSVTFPSTLKTIGADSFRTASISTLSLPEGLQTIGSFAFSKCNNLTTITIPGGVTFEGQANFNGCANLRTVYIEDGVTALTDYMFMGCNKLVSITIPDSIVSIDSMAFQWCTALETVELVEGNTPATELGFIGIKTFSGCTNLKSITLPTRIESIGRGAFEECSNLLSIRIPDSVTTIDTTAFYLCTALQEVTLSKNLTSLGEQAFRGCKKLTKLTFPEDSVLESIGGYAFYECIALTEVTIPASVKSILIGAFYGCASMKTVYLPHTVTTFEEAAFRQINSTVKFYITSPSILSNAERLGSPIRQYLITEYGIYSTNSTKYYYKYDSTGKTGNIFFTDVTNMKPVGSTTLSVPRGSTIDLKVTITTNSGDSASKTASWTIAGATDSTTGFVMEGNVCKVNIGTKETGPLTIMATSDYDTSKTVTYTLNITSLLYTVSFNTDGGSTINDVKVEENKLLNPPVSPTKKGYVFKGWYTDTSYTTPWAFASSLVTANMTLYAKWEAKNCTITFTMNGTTVPSSIPNQTITTGGKIVKPVDPARAGYRFVGWYSDIYLTKPWDFDNDTVPDTMRLYAKWEAMDWTVTFNTNGGSSIVDSTVKTDQRITKPTNPTKSGYIFDGWYKEDTFTTAWNFSSDVVTENTTLYAKWKVDMKTVVFNSNGGSSISNASVVIGNKVTKPTDPIRAGYTFVGWYSNSALTTVWDFDMNTVNSNLTLYAKWEANSNTVKFNSNGGSSVADSTVKTGEKISQPVNPTKTGYTFAGWYSDIGLTTAWNFNTDIVTNNLTLYAKWQANDNTITFNSNGGSSVADSTVKTGEKISQPVNPTKTGYTFAGWYSDIGLTTAWNFNTDIVTNNLTLYAKWQANDNTIIFNSNGGSSVADSTVKTGEKISQPVNPTKTGYTFAGWYQESTLTNEWDFTNAIVSSDMTLYAKWEALDWTVTFEMNGITVPVSIPNQTIKTDNKIEKPVDPARTGYTFAGWYSDRGLMTAWNFDTDIVSGGNITLYAKWEAMNWTITFDVNGGSHINDIMVKTGKTITKPIDPTKIGYLFVSWYSDSALTTAWDFTTNTVNSDITLYAKWEAADNSITFQSNGGTNIAPVTVKTGNKIVKPDTPTKKGYTFVEWYSDSALTTAWNFDTDIVSGGNITLYAKWIVNPFTVTFDSNGGNYTPDTQDIEIGNKISKPIDPTKNGYTFNGWYSDCAFATVWDFAGDTVQDDITLYAKWEARDNTIIFNSNGGNSVPNTIVKTGNKIMKPTNPIKVGYVFGGWYSDSTCTTIWNFDNDVVTGGNMILYAKWVVNPFTITFDSNGGNYTPSNQSIEVSNKISKPTNPTKKGYIFNGWYSDSGLITAWDFDIDLVSSDVTLYAKWTAKDNTVTFHSNGGSVINNSTVKTGNKLTEPMHPTKTGYTFIGWFKESTFTTLWDFTNDVVAEDMHLYAKWEANTYTISFDMNGITIPSTIPNQNIKMDAFVNKPADPLRAGYTFSDWYSDNGFTKVWDFNTDTVSENMTLYAKWEAIDWRITFDTNGGSNITDILVKTDQKISKPDTPTKPGYIFAGWYKEDTYTTRWDFDSNVVSENTTLYAKWEEQTSTVIFQCNGGNSIENMTVKIGDKISKPVDPIKSGYTFNGWFSDSALTKEWNFATNTVHGNLTLYAKWSAKDNTVIFHTNGGSIISNSIVKTDEKIIKPINPIKQGYDFVGWYKDSSSMIPWDFDKDVVTGDTTLYAVWKAKTNVDDIKEVEASIPSGTVEKGTEVSLSVATPGAKIYYTIDGSEPTTASPLYTKPIAINTHCIIKAFASKDEFSNSQVAVFTYTVIATGDVTIKVDVDNSEVGVTVPNEETVLEAVLTQEDKAAYEKGQDIIITLDCKLLESFDVVNEEHLQGHQIGQYLDISIYKKIGNKEVEAVHKLNREIEITIEVPQNLLPEGNIDRTYKMLRIHEGKSNLLDDLDKEVSTITIVTDRFSTYVIVYKDTVHEKIIHADKQNSSHTTILNTGDPTRNMGAYLIMMCSSLAFVLLMKKRGGL